MKLEIVCRETIKPLFSTPPELGLHHLCLFDRQAPFLYLQFLYFYENTSNSKLLKESLSKALILYYPFAGRLKDRASIDCNDMGVTFLEAKLRCPMSEFMNADDSRRKEILKLLCFDDMNGKDQRFNPLLCIQLTRFECGGEAICVFLSHKLADTLTFTNFMSHWASISCSSGGGHDMPPLAPPQFNAASLFKPDDDDLLEVSEEIVKGDKNLVSKRLMFEGSKIATLKAMVSEKMENPTRVQVVAALIYKAAISASRSMVANDHSKTHPTHYLLTIPINLRTRVVPPMPPTLSGNIISFFLTSSTTADQKEIEVWRLTSDMKRNMEEFCNKYPKKYKVEEWCSLYKLHMKESIERMSDQSVYTCSSWCRFPFYDADFGWGKPLWITAPVILYKNVIILMDAKDGEGVEALVSLEKEQMEVFEKNEDLLSFCEIKT